MAIGKYEHDLAVDMPFKDKGSFVSPLMRSYQNREECEESSGVS